MSRAMYRQKDQGVLEEIASHAGVDVDLIQFCTWRPRQCDCVFLEWQFDADVMDGTGSTPAGAGGIGELCPAHQERVHTPETLQDVLHGEDDRFTALLAEYATALDLEDVDPTNGTRHLGMMTALGAVGPNVEWLDAAPRINQGERQLRVTMPMPRQVKDVMALIFGAEALDFREP